MTAALKAILKRRMLNAAGEPMAADRYVFGNEIGERVGSIKKAWGSTCRRAGIEGLHFHDLRREAASRKLELDEPWGIHEISIWLGHSNVVTTVRYLGVSERSVHRLAPAPPERRVG